MTIEYLVGKKKTFILASKKIVYNLVVAVVVSLSRIRVASRAPTYRRAHTRGFPLAHAKIFFRPMLKPHVPALQTRKRTHALENLGWPENGGRSNNAGKASPCEAHM